MPETTAVPLLTLGATLKLLTELSRHHPADTPLILLSDYGYAPVGRCSIEMYRDERGSSGAVYPTPEALRDSPVLREIYPAVPSDATRAVVLWALE